MFLTAFRRLFILSIFAAASLQAGAADFYFSSQPVTRVATGKAYSYHFEAKDSLGKAIIYSVHDLPAWLTYSPAQQTISGTAPKPGQFLIHLHASNDKQTIRQDFVITVTDSETKNILCLGNSITNGTSAFNSYRRPLWNLLKKGNYNFDFIGSWSQHHMGGPVPDPDFDMDHEGHSGWTAAHVFSPPDWDTKRGNITEWLTTYSPDIVLLELGTNDVFQCRTTEEVEKDFTALVQTFRKKNPKIKIIVGNVLPMGKLWGDKDLCGKGIYSKAITEMNVMFTRFVSQHTTTASPVVLVDLYSGLNDEKYLYDAIHPNNEGEAIMATLWLKALTPYLSKLHTQR